MTDWCPFAERIETAAYGYNDLAPGAMQPIAVISHIMQGYQRTMIGWARERPATTMLSVHFTIGREGRIAQHVGIRDAAYHAGLVAQPGWKLYRPGTNPNRYTVGIEHEGFSAPPSYGFDYLYDAVHPWPEPMVLASIRVHQWIIAETGIVPSEDTIIGHSATDSVNRARDPGPMWPRERLLAALRGPSAAAPPMGGINGYLAGLGLLGRRVESAEPDERFWRYTVSVPKKE